MIDREVFLAAAKALRRQGFDAIDDDNRINVTVDGTHRSVDTAEFSIWLVAEHDEKEASMVRIQASAARSLSSTEAAMTSRDMSLHGGERIPYQEPWTMPERPWLVRVVKRRHRWAVWCPCCRQWSACESFADSLEVVRDILPTGWEIRRLSEGGGLVKR